MPLTTQKRSTIRLALRNRMSTVGIFLKALLFIMVFTGISSGALSWQWMNPRPQGNHLFDVTYAQGSFYAVGGSGTIITSSDGRSWKVNHVSASLALYSIAFGNGRFVVVGKTGTIFSSVDGTTWEKQQSNTRRDLRHIIFAADRFVAIGDSSILVSPDGASWSTTYSDRRNELMSVTYGKGHYVVAGRNIPSPISYFLMTSTDGSEWMKLDTTEVSSIHSVAFIDDKFMALNFDEQFLISDDAVNWDTSASGLPPSLESIVKMDNHLISWGPGMEVSSDGESWTRYKIDTTKFFYGCAVGNGLAVAVGEYGIIAVSSDAALWEITSRSMDDTLESIAYGNNIYVAVGEKHSVLTSHDGAVWTKNDTANGLQRFSTPHKIMFVNGDNGGSDGFFLVAGSAGLATSTDGANWTMALLPFFGRSLYSVCGNSKRLVAVGEKGTIVTSSDGKSWAACSTGTTQFLTSVAYSDEISGGLFAAAGYGGLVFTSSDGITWIRRKQDNYDKFLSLTAGNGKFVSLRWFENAANGFADSVMISTDGILWEKKRTNTIAELISIVSGGGKFVGATRDGGIYESVDGLSWSGPYQCSDSYFKGASYANNHFAVLGARSILFSSEGDSRSIIPQKKIHTQTGTVCIVKRGSELMFRITVARKAGDFFSFHLFTPDGRRIISKSISNVGNVFSMPAADLAAGLYLVKIVRRDGGYVSSKFLNTP